MAADPPIMLMDEPFGAIDPIARDRLQNDFLRLHRQIPKTIIFVTHDIDEAIKMGDRIAIMRDGKLVQMATADDLLAKPANEFVAQFVGADRGLKRLRVRGLDEVDLDPPTSEHPTGPTISHDSTLHYALSLMLAEGTTRIDVVDGDRHPVGSIRMDAITKLIAPHDGPADAAPVHAAASAEEERAS